MFSASAEYYDLIYFSFKDYAAEVALVVNRLRGLNPRCRTVLDVGCGTGEHAKRLAAEGFSADGIDIEPAFVRIASRKHPAGRFVQADMSDFALGQRYDVVLCLFSSIGYLCTLDRVTRALICFSDHLEPGGVMLVEPWLPPGVLDPEKRFTETAESGGVKVTRRSHVEIIGTLSRLFLDYEIEEHGLTRHLSEVHELGLFTTEEMTQAFHAAGLNVEHDAKGLIGRGLFIAKRAQV